MEEIEKLKNVLTENNVTEVRKIESNCFEQRRIRVEIKADEYTTWKTGQENY